MALHVLPWLVKRLALCLEIGLRAQDQKRDRQEGQEGQDSRPQTGSGCPWIG
ncbi:hypothetical protein SynSYN20_01818 [Synechococcus sp. SYN20]|nr:hypothetical protein SynSYN20_01818 [Synechococcus sp. SYN20]